MIAAVGAAASIACADSSRDLSDPCIDNCHALGYVVSKVQPGVDPQRAALAVERILSDLAGSQVTVAMAPTLDLVGADTALAQRIGLDRYWTIILPGQIAASDAAKSLDQLSDLFESVEVDALAQTSSLVTDPLFDQQWSLQNTGQNVGGVVGTPGADIGILNAWDYTKGRDFVVVAVLDTGVSASHPELEGRLVPGQNFSVTPPTTNADDNTTNSHGTYVAGIIAANADNGVGIAGIAPGVKIMPIRVFTSSGYGTETFLSNGLRWAADNGADIANMSLGFPQGSALLRDTVIYADGRGLMMVAATGNTPGAVISYPAKWSRVIAVGSTDNQDAVSIFTTTGAELDISAPGENILTLADTLSAPNDYSYQSGTSMAAPMIAGVAALCKSIYPEATNAQIREFITSSVQDLGAPGWDTTYGAGRVRADAALSAAFEGRRLWIADADRNSIVEVADIFFFLSTWFSNSADLNLDGLTSLTDIFVFFEAWYMFY